MKKIRVLILSFLVLLISTGCGTENITIEMPSEPLVFTENDSSLYDCVQLEYDGKTYIPYCAASVEMCDKVIGYYEITDNKNTDLEKAFILSCKDWDSGEWIVDCSGNEGENVSGHNIGMLYREESVTDIPEDLQGKSDYEWNK